MKDKDQHLLWEAYLSEKHHDEEKGSDEKKNKEHPPHDDGDGKKERCDYVPCEEEVEGVQEEDMKPDYDSLTPSERERLGLPSKGELEQNKQMEDDLKEQEAEDKHVTKENVVSEQAGVDYIDDAIRNLTGDLSDDGDWEGAIRDIMRGVAERMIFHANTGDGGVTKDPDLADRWDLKVGINDAVSDLLNGNQEELKAGFKKAFHNARNDEERGRFDFSNDTLLKRISNGSYKKPEHDDEPLYYPRDRESG